MEHVSDLLASKHPQFNTASIHCLVSDALYQMRCENVDYLIIMEDGKFKGIITDHDIAAKILFEDRPLNRIRVNEFLNSALPFISFDATLQKCMELMERYNVRHLAVYEQFEFKGVISSQDLMHEAIKNRSVVYEEEESESQQLFCWYY